MCPKRRFPIRIAGLAAFLLLLAGCDTVDTGEEVVLDVEETFDFVIDEDLTPGTSVEITSSDVGDIGGQLSGFSKDEIVSATVTGVTIERLQPPATNLDEILSSAAVSLTGAGTAQIASLSSAPGDETAQMALGGSANVASFLSGDTFGARLDFEAADAGIPEGPYVLRVTMEFQVALEGL